MPINAYAVVIWLLRLLAAGIMFQTLFFKFSAAEESVYIFSAIGMEPWGRIGIGILELISVILILNLRTIALGALLGMGVMAGAIFFHLTILGIIVKDDGGQLFVYALLVFFSCLALAIIFRKDLLFLKSVFLNRRNRRDGHAIFHGRTNASRLKSVRQSEKRTNRRADFRI